MTITALGTLSVGGAVPGCAVAVTAGMAGINGALPDIEARLEALQGFSPQPINFGVQLALAEGIVASIKAGIALGLPVPSLTAQAAAVSALIASLHVQVALVNGHLDVLTALVAPLAVAGVAVYAFDGPTNTLGSEIDAVLGGGTAHANALVMFTTNPTTWAAMSAVLKVS